MTKVYLNLLQSEELQIDTLEASYKKMKARGTYNPMQFVLRLREDIHQVLKKMPPGIYTPDAASAEQFQAFSTLLHETIHWWQHVGSNFGLITSLQFPAQAHVLHDSLKKFLHDSGATKSIRKFNEKTNSTDPTTNYILNSWYDIEVASMVAFDPLLINKYIKNPYFECLGHSYHLMWSSSIWTLATVADKDLLFLPDIRNWEKGFNVLTENKEPNFYYGSPATIARIGTKAIFEGQARFSQLQYLYFAFGQTYNLKDFGNMGMLDGIYGEAFSHFLVLLNEEPPKELTHSLVGLFLLICDISMNPTDGFPFDITHYQSFLITNDPGQRFHLLCSMVKIRHPELKSAIQQYSKQEYIEISKTLASSIACVSPYESCAHINQWIEQQQSLKQLLDEEASFTYQPANLPVRLFFAKFLRFQQDKFVYPDVLCWPGIRFAGFGQGSANLQDVQKLFNRHAALFVDDEDGDIHPSIFTGCDEKQITKTFDDFYAWNALYDMVRQWIIEPGPFKYNYRWMTSTPSAREIKTWATDIFFGSFGHKPDNFHIL